MSDLQPEYYFGYGVSDANLPSLEAVKTWMEGEERRFDTLTVNEYGMYDEATDDERVLESMLEKQGLEAAMNLAESMAVAGGYLDPQRTDPRIFFEDDAPTDPFTTNRQREIDEPSYTVGAVSANGESFLDVYKEWGAAGFERLVIPQLDWETARDTAMFTRDLLAEDRLQDAMRIVEAAGIEAGVIDPERADPRLFTLGPPDPFATIRQEQLEIAVAQHPYWRMETLPVHTPDGEPLGHALHMVVYPHVEQDSGMVGSPTIADTEPFRLLEMAHFETTEAAEEFGREFKGYLIPGLLEAPELAVEVARLEGLPAEWRTLESDDLTAYRSAELMLTRDPADWHPYNPHAERDARIETEGLYVDPVWQATDKVELASRDVDL